MSAGNTYNTTSLNANRLVNIDGLKAEIAEAMPLSKVAAALCDVELIPAGHQQKGMCPLHDDSTPSFFVNDAKGLYHCFGCKLGGDAIDLVQRVHHLGFRDALVKLGIEAGVDVAKYERPATDDEKKLDQLRAWCESYVGGWLPTNTQRTSEATAQEYGIVVPATPQGPYPEPLKDKRYLFEGEALFPYRTSSGKLVGWKVRHADKKMFMTPNDFPLAETVVWGLDVARPHIEDELIVVEGEWDTAVLYDEGVQNVAGIGGSKWTDEHMEVLEAQKIRRVCFLLDGDEGGRSAGEVIGKRYWRHPTIQVRIALAWQGADPEDMVRALGPDAIRQQVAEARGALEWLLFQEWQKEPRDTLTRRMDFVRWVQDEYGDQLVGVEQTLVLREVAKWLELPEADVLDFARASKTVLQAPDSEKVVLARAIRDLNYFVDVRKRIALDDLYVTKHRRVWEVLTSMLADGLDFDVATVRRKAEAAGVPSEYVDLLAETGDLNIGWHEEQVIDLSVRRASRASADYFREIVADLSVPANQLIGSLTHDVTTKALGRGNSALMSTVEQVDSAMETLHERMKNPDAVIGLDLGSQFPQLTQMLQGLQRRRLVTVAARSGMGKSTIVVQWFAGLAVHYGIPTDFVSLEMDYDEILFKACAHLTGIDSQKISGGRLEGDEIGRVERAMMRLRKSPFRVYAPDSITPNEFLLFAREAVMERRTEIFALDFIQQVGADPETRKLQRYEQLGQAAYLLKQKVCRGLDVGVICIAQLRRDLANTEEPTPEDMGDSYEIVRASDAVILLAEQEGDRHEVWLGKNRQGAGQLVLPANFDKPSNTWREMAGAKTPDYLVS